MSKIYYGAGEIPKGKVKATMPQAAKAKQVRLYGVYKIDPVILKSEQNKVKVKDNKMEILKEIFRNKGKQRKIEIQIADNKEEEIKDYKKINKELQKESDKLEVLNKKLYKTIKELPENKEKEEEEEEPDTLEKKPVNKMTELELRRILIRLRTRKTKYEKELEKKEDKDKRNEIKAMEIKIAEASETLKKKLNK
jgi:hypothetical protein